MLPLLLVAIAADLTPETVANLRPAWTFHTEAKAPSEGARKISAFESKPVFADGTLYVITPYNQVIALDPEVGAERWRYDAKIPANRDYSEVSARGVAVANGKVYFGTLDARLIALDAKTGKLVFDRRLSEQPTDGNYQVTSPPVVVGNTVIVGSAIGDNSRAEMDRGTVRAFDATTGKLKWTWDPTPPGRTGAANAWAPMSIDAERDMVFLPTGSASPDFFGGMRTGRNDFANSVVALRASTGQFLWSFQVVHHDLWDYDVASQPVLMEFRGKPAIGALTKVGHYFALDRITGKPLLPVEERKVPASKIAGEAAWATQPYPVSGVFTEQKFVARPGWCAEQVKTMRYDGLFTPPSLEGTLVFPGNVGGANWGGGTYDAEQGLLFVAANRLATVVKLIPRAEYDRAGHGDTGERLGQSYGAQKGAGYGMSRRTFTDLEGRPCNVEPWGALVAIEVATGKVKWESPMTVSLGGPLTVGGVVFFGGTIFEGKLRAFRASDGEKLWEANLPASAHSVPGKYVWNGRRYVVVCAGGHGKVDGSKLGDAVVAFRLD